MFETPLPKQIDKIVVFSGASGQRVEKAVELYNLYHVPIIMTGDRFFLHSVPYYMKELAVSLGVPEEDIFLEENSLSTADHMKNVIPLLDLNRDKAIMIVTSKYHTRRSYYISSKLVYSYDLSLYITGANDEIDYDSWWRHYEMCEKVSLEWGRLIFYWIFW